MSGFLSGRIQPVLMGINASSSYTVAASSSVDLSAYGCDSMLIVATVHDTTLTGFTMTATHGASTSAMVSLQGAAGSGSTAVLTVGTTAPAKVCWIDVRNCPSKFCGANHTGLAASVVSILGFPYDSKKQRIPYSTSLGSAVAGSSNFVQAHCPTST